MCLPSVYLMLPNLPGLLLLHIYTLQIIKDWRCERPGNEGSTLAGVGENLSFTQDLLMNTV